MLPTNMEYMEYTFPLNIWFLAPAIAAAAIFVVAFAKKEKILRALRVGRKIRFKAPRAILMAAGLGLIAFSLTGPQIFDGYTEIVKTGLDVYVLMDTSKSMLVTDIAPDRMSIAKKIAGGLLDRLDGDRIGFIPFASDAYIQMPLTDDYGLARMFLDVMDTDMISGGGTNIAAALRLANDSFKRSSESDRVVLIISDGEEHDGAALNMMKSLSESGIKIYAIGVGTEFGGLVPVYDERGETVIDYMRDVSGNPVTSRLKADALAQLAREGGGKYYQATMQGAEITSLLEDISSLKRGELSTEQGRRFRQLYQYFLAPGLLLFLIAWLLPESRAIAAEVLK